MPRVRGLDVYLRVDGRRSQEYGTYATDGSSADCYVASEEGKPFEVHVTNTLADTPLACDVWIDGYRARKFFCHAGASQKTGGAHTASGRRQFRFTKLEVTDDESRIDTLANNWDSMGTIEVRVMRCRSYRNTFAERASLEVALPSGPVHELSKKAGTHRVSLEAAKPYKGGPHRVIITRPLDSADTPYITVRFRYRPAELLQAQGIISMQDEEDHKLAVEGTDADDIASIEEQIRRLQARLAERKDAGPATVVKREMSPISVPQAVQGERIVIDLTKDI